MNQQVPLFFESPEEALSHLVGALGGAKTVAAAMRPDLSPDNAARWLKDCLNADRRERLAPGQVMYLLRLGREHGIHDAMNYLAGDCGYATPEPITAADEQAELLRSVAEGQRWLAAQMAKFERSVIASSKGRGGVK